MDEPSFTMNMTPSVRFALAATCTLFLWQAARAGTPLICHPYAIGDAPTLPGGTWKGADPSYDRTNLVRDTLALLKPETPVIVRMETLRRAAIYATANMRGWAKNAAYTTEDRAIAGALLAHLRERTTAAPDRDRALALFDLGFFTETLRQTNLDPALDGYDLLLKVAELRPTDAEVQFALALASSWPKRRDYSAHLAQATAGARPGTLLAENLESHLPR
ncbi:MAG TPA: hypothetical protein VG734_01230 [Lacunisphaera sp.]|nr:hypothetical protein [Lacunisphaera sp.]